MSRVVIILFAYTLASTPGAAQFRHLSTDQSGSRVWFSSALPQRGSGQHNRDKIFAADVISGVSLVAQRPVEDPYHLLVRPQVSAAGTTLAHGADFYCFPGFSCPGREFHHSVVSTTGKPDREFIGEIEMSRNGRYLLRHSYVYFGPSGQVELIDLETNMRMLWAVSNFEPMTGAIQVTSDGAALIYADGLWLIRLDGSFDFVPTGNFILPPESGFDILRFGYPRAAINDAGTRVVYQTTVDTPSLIVTAPGVASSERELVRTEFGAFAPVLSADGSIVLFLSRADFKGGNPAHTQQAWTVAVDSGEIRQATVDPAGIAEATLSGDGAVVWAVTFGGRLIRIDLAASRTDEVIGRTAVIDADPLGTPFPTAPGALFTLTGRGPAAEFEPSGLPLARELNTVQVRFEGEPLPLLFVSPTEIRAQIPWELLGPRPHHLEITPTNSPFDDDASRRLPIVIQDAAPQFEFLPGFQPIIAHEDFRGLVSESDPAVPGEILHMYLTGLGAVDPAVALGQPAPLDRLSRVTGTLHVLLSGDQVPVFYTPDVLFAGLAPGFVGVYQLSLRLPNSVLLPPKMRVRVQVGDAGANALAAIAVRQPL